MHKLDVALIHAAMLTLILDLACLFMQRRIQRFEHACLS